MDEKGSPPLELESEPSTSSASNDEGEEKLPKVANASGADAEDAGGEEEEGGGEKCEERSFSHLPMIVMEYILAHFSYFEVLQLRLISSFWNDLVKGYLEKADEVFLHNLARHNVQWLSVKEVIEDFKQPSEEQAITNRSSSSSSSNLLKKPFVPKMSPRYHHCACYINESMYIFGGCIAPNTAYNDLWRFDLASKHWHRIIATGTPPLPRLFCSFTPYEAVDEETGETRQYIVLFGGFLFDEKLSNRDRLLFSIHLYDIAENRWTQLPIVASPAEKEGGELSAMKVNHHHHPEESKLLLRSGNHSAVVIGDQLIVFNGLRFVSVQPNSTSGNTTTASSSPPENEVPCNHVYAYHLKEHYWRRVDGYPEEEELPADHNHNYHHQAPRRISSVRLTLEATQPIGTRRKAATQTPVLLDAHNILYICGCSTNVLFIAAFLLTRKLCHEPECENVHCQKQRKKQRKEKEKRDAEMMKEREEEEEEEAATTFGVSMKKQKVLATGRIKMPRGNNAIDRVMKDNDTLWRWEPVKISKDGPDFKFTYGVEFCKVGNMMAYLTAKDVAVPVRRPPPPPPQPPPPTSAAQSREPKQRLSISSEGSETAQSSTLFPLSSSPGTTPKWHTAATVNGLPPYPALSLRPDHGREHHHHHQHLSTHSSNRATLRDLRNESLDYYQRQFELLRSVNNEYIEHNPFHLDNDGNNEEPTPRVRPAPAVITRRHQDAAQDGSSSSTTSSRAVQLRSTLQLSLLDISRVITERRIDRIRQRHEMDYSVVPEALSAYSLVAAPNALLLFGGYHVRHNHNQTRGGGGGAQEDHHDHQGPAANAVEAAYRAGGGGGSKVQVSSKLFIISSKPEMRLF